MMEDRAGTLDDGKLADVLVLKASHDDPYENFARASMQDIELLVLAGAPIYGEARFLDVFRGNLPEGYSQIEVGGREMFVKGDPEGLYNRIREKVGFRKTLDYLPFEPRAREAPPDRKPAGAAECGFSRRFPGEPSSGPHWTR